MSAVRWPCAPRKARELAASVPHLRGAAREPADRAAVLVAQLERGTIGGDPTLERLLREDVLGREHLARGFLTEDEWDAAADARRRGARPLGRRCVAAAGAPRADRALDRASTAAASADPRSTRR